MNMIFDIDSREGKLAKIYQSNKAYVCSYTIKAKLQTLIQFLIWLV